MSKYEYKCVPAPKSFNTSKEDHQKAVEYYQNFINYECQDGWRLKEVDTVSSVKYLGCLSSLLGNRTEVISYKIMIFERLI